MSKASKFLWIINVELKILFNRFYRKKKLVERYEIPSKLVASCAFGGEDMDTLYVLTAKMNLGLTDGSTRTSNSSNDGKLYIIKGEGLHCKGYCGRKACLQKELS